MFIYIHIGWARWSAPAARSAARPTGSTCQAHDTNSNTVGTHHRARNSPQIIILIVVRSNIILVMVRLIISTIIIVITTILIILIMIILIIIMIITNTCIIIGPMPTASLSGARVRPTGRRRALLVGCNYAGSLSLLLPL